MFDYFIDELMWIILLYDVIELCWWEGFIFICFKIFIFIELVSGWKIEDMIVCVLRKDINCLVYVCFKKFIRYV